jgi:hypothetical protein
MAGSANQPAWWYGNTSPLLAWIYGLVPFKQTMAKIPAVTIYDSNNGAANSVYSYPDAVHRAISTTAQSDGGISQLTFTTTPTVGNLWLMGHYVADTGW